MWISFHKGFFRSLCVVASVKYEARVRRMVSLQLAAVFYQAEESRAALYSFSP